MAQAASLREVSTVKKMNDRSLLLSLNKITNYFKKWSTASGVLKTIYCLYKNLMLQIDPLDSSCSQKQQYPKRTLRLKVQMLATALRKYLLRFMNNCNYCCEIVKLTESNCSESHPCK